MLICLLVVCTSCQSGDKTARRGKPDTQSTYQPRHNVRFREVQLASLKVPLPTIADAEYVNDDSLCMNCHETYAKTFQHNVHHAQSCEKCHGPGSQHVRTRGKEPNTILSFRKLTPPRRSEVCLQCHEQNQCEPGSQWRTSAHAHKGVACTDCHTSHYNVPPGTPPTKLVENDGAPRDHLVAYLQVQPPVDEAAIRANSRKMGAITPHICYRCHASLAPQQNIAASHQICGAIAFDCKTCHDPHAKLRHETRTDLCLKCHDNNSPTMAWHSSKHANYGVACTDCHNPHPSANVNKIVNINHTNIRRAPRAPMSVDEPTACYGCHPQVYAQNALPSHHPIKEGKMVCSECHDPHGQFRGGLNDSTVNLVCYRCHAEKQGPFAYEHPPVSENCAICHEAHGTVANNLLRQPPNFLCLRCHTGHRTGPQGPNHNSPANGVLLGDIGTNPALQRAFYSDCTQCHSQIHGSDLPSPHTPIVLQR